MAIHVTRKFRIHEGSAHFGRTRFFWYCGHCHAHGPISGADTAEKARFEGRRHAGACLHGIIFEVEEEVEA